MRKLQIEELSVKDLIAEVTKIDATENVGHTDAPDANEGDSHNRFSGNSPTIERAADLLARDFPEPKWAVKDLLTEGATIFAGAPKVGKSWCALGFAQAIAGGGLALDSLRVEQGDVLYLALEDGDRRMKKRLQHLLDGEAAPEKLSFAYNWQRLDEGGLDALEGWLKTHSNARLIVVDTLKRVRPRTQAKGNGRLYDDDYDAVSQLNDLALKYRVAILIVHHTNKRVDAEDWFDLLSGTLGLTGAVDSAMLLRRRRMEKTGTLYAGGRDYEDKEIKLEWDASKFRWKTLGEALSETAERVLGWLVEAGETGLSKTGINEKNGNRDSEDITVALAELNARGFAKDVLRDKPGRGQQWVATSA